MWGHRQGALGSEALHGELVTESLGQCEGDPGRTLGASPFRKGVWFEWFLYGVGFGKGGKLLQLRQENLTFSYGASRALPHR